MQAKTNSVIPLNRNTLNNQEVVNGLIKLVDGQLAIGREFGLSRERLFPASYHCQLHRDLATELNRLILSPVSEQQDLQLLFQDLLQHQLALVVACDGVAKYSLWIAFRDGLKQRIQQSSLWRIFTKKREAFEKPAYLQQREVRQRQVVIPSFVQAYARAREYYFKQESEV